MPTITDMFLPQCIACIVSDLCAGLADHVSGSTMALTWWMQGLWGAPLAQCAHSATIWASGCPKNPYFVTLGASLLFGNRLLMVLPHWG